MVLGLNLNRVPQYGLFATGPARCKKSGKKNTTTLDIRSCPSVQRMANTITVARHTLATTDSKCFGSFATMKGPAIRLNTMYKGRYSLARMRSLACNATLPSVPLLPVGSEPPPM